MAWNDTKNEGDLISNTDWNDHVSVTMQTSGAFWAHSSNSDIHFTQSDISISGNQVILPNILTPTYKYVSDWFKTIQSAGKISGGDISDNGDGSVSVSAGTGIIKITDSDTSETKFFNWSSESSLTLTDGTTNYIYVSYNSGNPIVTSSTSLPTDKNTNVMLGLVFRDGTILHIVTAGALITNYAKNTLFKDLELNGKFQRTSGVIISETGTRNIAISQGTIYAGLTKVTFPAFDSSGADTFTYYYRDGSGGWTKVTDQSQIDNLHYDDGSGTLATLGPNKYGVHWVYADPDGCVFVVYGQDNYTLSNADLAQPPSSLPQIITDICGLVGKIIIKKSDSSFTSIESAYTQKFSPSLVYSHNDLSDIQGGTTDEYYHLTNSEYNIATQPATATQDGYLSSTDWNTFNNKQDSFNFGVLTNGNGINSLNVGISGSNSTISVDFGSGDTQVASGSHLHDNRYYTKSQSDSLFYPSSIGAGLSGSYHTHRLDVSAHHTRYTNEEAQDAVGNILDDGSLGEIIFTYDDNTPKIYGVVQDSEIDHNQLSNTHNLTTDIDHGSISGLDDDDHPQYYNQDRISTISSNAVSGQLAKAWLDASGSKYNTAYQHSQTTTGNPHNIDLNDLGESKGDLLASSPLSFTNTRQVLGGSTTISITQAGNSSDGYLTASDWNNFNNKQDSFTHGVLSNGTGIQIFSVGISGSDAMISVEFGKTNTTVASGSHLHDDRYYTESESDSNFFPSSLGHSHINNTSNPHNVTYSQVGAIQDTSDVIKDTHIDWGTGANQVSLDDVPDGTLYARLTTTQKTDLTDGNDTTLHYHASDRDLNNATGTLGISHGGTNNTSYTTDKFLIYDGSKITSSTYDDSSFATASHTHSASDITTGTLAHERGGLEADVSGYNGLVKIAGGTTSYITDNSSNWNTAYTHSQITTGNPHQISVSDLSDSNINSLKSGQILTYAANLSDSTWQNVLPPMTFSTPTVGLKGNRFIRLARFDTGGKKCYLWQASASDYNGSSVYELKIQLLSGSSVIYSTSSNTIQQGHPLAETSGKITIRLAYSGSSISDTDEVKGLGFMQVSIY